METARKSAAALQLKHNSLRESVQRQRQELSLAGINTRTLAADERKLKATLSETTSQLNRQREALARVSAQQEKLSRVKQRYQPGRRSPGMRQRWARQGREWQPRQRLPGRRC